jgi:hypothetical protein
VWIPGLVIGLLGVGRGGDCRQLPGEVRMTILGIERWRVVGGGVVAGAGTGAAGLAVERIGFHARRSISLTLAE